MMNPSDKSQRLVRRVVAIAARTELPLPSDAVALEQLARESWALRNEHRDLTRTANGRQASWQVRAEADYESLFVALYA